jgi:hypothetical protein
MTPTTGCDLRVKGRRHHKDQDLSPSRPRGAPLLASHEENEWPREDHTNPFAQPERTGIVGVHQKSQDQPGAKVEPRRRATAPDRRAHAVSFRRRRDQHRFCGKTPSITDFWTNRGRRAAHLGPAVLTPARGLPSGWQNRYNRWVALREWRFLERRVLCHGSASASPC